MEVMDNAFLLAVPVALEAGLGDGLFGWSLTAFLAVAFTAGNLRFGAAGLVLTLPLLRRCCTAASAPGRHPAVAVVGFAAMFPMSAFVIGPAISGSGSCDSPDPRNAPRRATAATIAEHPNEVVPSLRIDYRHGYPQGVFASPGCACPSPPGDGH